MSIKPKLGTFDLSMIVISLVIGFGIFRTPAIVANAAQSVEVFFLVWLIGGIISLCGAFTFAEIGARYPVPGGFYQIFSHCYHPAYALMLNWVLLLTMAASFAGAALIGAEYIVPVIFPEDLQTDLVEQMIAVGMIVLLWVLNYMGIKTGSRAQNLLSVLKILLIGGICLAIFGEGNTDIPHSTTDVSSSSWLVIIATSLIPVFFTFGGYHQTMNFGGDIKDPQKNIPRSILIGIGIIIILYLFINYAYYHVLGFEGIKNADLVAAEVTGILLGDYGSAFISITIFISVMGFLNATLLSTPRMYYAMAEDKMLPNIFKQVNPQTQVQEFSLAFYVIASLVSLFVFKSFENILNYVMFIDSLALGTAAAAIFILRRRQKETNYRGFKIPLYPIVPALFVIFLIGVSLNILINDTGNALPGLALFLMGFPIYLAMKKISNT